MVRGFVRRHPKLFTAVGAVAVLAAVTSPLWWRAAAFLVKLAVPAPAYSAAADRTSDPAATVAGPALPTPATVAAGTGDEAPSISLERVVDLDTPTALADLPGEDGWLVTTRAGRVFRIDPTTGRSETVLDLSSRVSTGGERGLLGIAVDDGGRRMYLNFSNRRGDNEIRSWSLRNGSPRPGPGVLHLRIGQPFENHNGGNLVFGPDGLLWIGTGDGGGVGDRGNVAQDPDSLLGKMLRVRPDAAGGVRAPRSNPDWDGRPEVWAIGLRNPWRYSFDRATRRLWIADVGQSSIEEVSVAAPNARRPNFGWNIVEGNNRYRGRPSPQFLDPAVEYGHDEGCSVTGGFVYRGRSDVSLYGWYLFGDYCGEWIRAVSADEPGTQPVELIADAGPVISFAELDDGELLVLTPEGVDRIVPG